MLYAAYTSMKLEKIHFLTVSCKLSLTKKMIPNRLEKEFGKQWSLRTERNPGGHLAHSPGQEEIHKAMSLSLVWILESPGNLLRISVPRLYSRLIKSEQQDLKDSDGPSRQLSIQRASDLEMSLQMVTLSLMQDLNIELLGHST